MKVHTVFTTRHEGDMRRKKAPDTIYAQQIHGNRVAVVSACDLGKTIAGVDGLVSKDSVRLSVHSADCVPVLAWEENAGVIGAAHAGWRGTLGNIAGNLMRGMYALGADPKKIRVSIGPHIGVCCYEVPEDRAKKFLPYATRFFNNAWYIDLGRANVVQLTDAGILRKNISVSNQCTACHSDRYFSYRKDLPAGRQAYGEQIGVIWIGKR